jgi:hypothetical protein
MDSSFVEDSHKLSVDMILPGSVIICDVLIKKQRIGGNGEQICNRRVTKKI